MSVEVGNVYEDNDPRAAGRTVEVMEIDGLAGSAHVRLNTPSRNVSKHAIGRRTWIRLDRLEGSDFTLSDVKPHRIGRHQESGVLGYWPIDEISGA